MPRSRALLIAALLSLALAPALAGTPLPDVPHVVVNGEGRLSVTPDSAIVTMTASHRSADAGTAKRTVDRLVDAFIEAAPKFGIDADDMTASDLTLREEVEYDDNERPRSRGHLAEREVKVRLDDIDKVGAFIDAALAAGLSEIDRVEAKSSQELRLREEARALAAADARQKATGLAQAFGGRLGPVYSINSVNSMQADGYGNTQLDRIEVTGSRIRGGRYLQPTLDFTERVSAVFEVVR